MRSREFLNETIRTPSWSDEDDSDISYKLKSLPKGLKPLPGSDSLMYMITKRGNIGWKFGNFHQILVIDPNQLEIAGKLIYYNADRYIPGAVEISYISTNKQYATQGVTLKMMKLLAVNLGKILLSDLEGGETPEARKGWVLLAKRDPELIVKGWVEIPIDFNFINFDESDIVKDIMKLGGQWLVHDKNHWIVAFDVVPNAKQTELMSYIKTSISKQIYHDEDYYDYTTGLLAMTPAKWQQITGYSPE